jgi:hypothetical protein
LSIFLREPIKKKIRLDDSGAVTSIFGLMENPKFKGRLVQVSPPVKEYLYSSKEQVVKVKGSKNSQYVIDKVGVIY